MANKEQLKEGLEYEARDPKLESLGDSRREAIREDLEKQPVSHEDLEDIRKEVEKVSVEREKETHSKEKEHTAERSKSERRGQGKISKKQKDIALKKTLKTVQADLPIASRAFSKLIHNKAVEKASDTVGATIARPNAILAGSICAFIFTLAIFLVARYYGYPLSGSETIAGFVVGWATGILFDYLRLMISGKTS